MAKIIIFSIIYLLSHSLMAQDCNAPKFRKEVHQAQKQLKSVEAVHQYYKKLIGNMQGNESCSLDSLAYAQLKYGISLSRKRLYEQAIEQLDKVEQTKQKSLSKDIDLVRAYHFRGEFYEKLGQLNQAILHFKTALAIQLDIDDNNQLEYRYMRLGTACQKLGDYKQAIENLEISKQIHLDIFGAKHVYTGEVYNDLGTAYTDNRDFKKAETALQAAIQIFKEKGKTRNLIKAYNNLGYSYGKQQLYGKAANIYKEAGLLCINNDSEDCIKATNNLGVALMKIKAYKEAEIYFNEALDKKHNQQNNLTFHYSYAATLENLADLKLQQGNHKDALQYYQKALLNLTDNFRSKNIRENPTISHNTFIYSKIDLIRALDLKAKAALKAHKKTKDKKYLDIAFQTYQTLDEWISIFYRDLTTDAAMLTWIAHSHEIYAHAIQVALQAEQAEVAFHFAERARAVLLWQSLSQLDARNLLSETDRKAEDQLNSDIRQNEQAYFDTQDTEKDSLRIVIQQLNLKKEKLIQSFEKAYPEYYNRKYDADFITLKQVQEKLLDEKSALIEYFLTDDILYIFTITQTDIFTKSIEMNTDFYENMSLFKNLISNPNSELTAYAKPAHALHQTLLAPVQNELPKQIDKLIIVPDGRLNYIVFEALLTQAIDLAENSQFNHKLPYLFKKYTLNYLYSCNSAFGLQQVKKHPDRQQFLGIAPVFSKQADCPLSALPNSKKEVTAIAEMYEASQVLMNGQSTRDNLLQHIPDADIIHIASHATQEGKIFLHNCEVLTQKDIQAQTWNTSHVILSACETGTGLLSKGEGVLSLGWSFAYKGVPSIVMSQWQASDAGTKDLMLAYHRFLREGRPADQALCDAKHYYFSDIATSTKEMHPYYWAAFIHSGQPVKATGHLQNLWTASTGFLPSPLRYGLFILGIVLFLWRFFK